MMTRAETPRASNDTDDEIVVVLFSSLRWDYFGTSFVLSVVKEHKIRNTKRDDGDIRPESMDRQGRLKT